MLWTFLWKHRHDSNTQNMKLLASESKKIFHWRDSSPTAQCNLLISEAEDRGWSELYLISKTSVLYSKGKNLEFKIAFLNVHTQH